MRSDSGYAYAKAGWIIGKSFLGKRLASLNGIHTLNELDKLIFPETHRELPGRELLIDLEKRIAARAIRQILSVVNSYPEPPKILVRLLKGIEYENLKECLSSIAVGKQDLPKINNIGRFGSIRFDAYPDIHVMLRKTEFEHLLLHEMESVKPGVDLTHIETKLDYRYYQGLIDGLSQLDSEEIEAAARLLADEISLRNCAWVLRLRTYYKKSEKEVQEYLLNLRLQGYYHYKKAELAAEAKMASNFSLDTRQEWRGWRWERFLNREDSGEHWFLDPRHFQNAASNYLYHLCFRNFHSLPMSVCAIYSFIKLIQFEEDLLTSVAEGLSLGMESSHVFKILEAT